MKAPATGSVMLSFNPLLQRAPAPEAQRPSAVPDAPRSTAAPGAPVQPRSPTPSGSPVAPRPAASGSVGVRPPHPTQDTGTAQTLGEFRTLTEAEQRRLLERLVSNIIANLSSVTDPAGQPKSEAQRRADRAGANLTRALFTKRDDDRTTEEPFGYIDLGRRMKAPGARLDQRMTDILGEYLRERDSKWIDDKIRAMGDPEQERALRLAVLFAEASLYADDVEKYEAEYQAAKREEADARAREKEAQAKVDIWTMVDRGLEYSLRGNHPQALSSYRQAAARGNAMAMCRIAVMHGKGEGVPKSESLDLEWSLKCARAGNAYGMWRVSLAYSTDPDLRRNFFPTISKNAAESFSWALKAARLGHRQAMRNLADMYGAGRGTKQDIAEANRWRQLADKAGGDPFGASGDSGK